MLCHLGNDRLIQFISVLIKGSLTKLNLFGHQLRQIIFSLSEERVEGECRYESAGSRPFLSKSGFRLSLYNKLGFEGIREYNKGYFMGIKLEFIQKCFIISSLFRLE